MTYLIPTDVENKPQIIYEFKNAVYVDILLTFLTDEVSECPIFCRVGKNPIIPVNWDVILHVNWDERKFKPFCYRLSGLITLLKGAPSPEH